jgi:sphingomyelin phosphodiesterase
VLGEYRLRVLALNTQACNDMNWFLLRDPTDPGNMLEWLYD